MKRIIIATILFLMFAGVTWAGSVMITGTKITSVRIGDVITTGYLVDHAGNRLVTHTPDNIIYRKID